MRIILLAQLSETSLNYVKPEDMKDVSKLLPFLSFSQVDFSGMGYTTVGRVEVDVDLLPPDQIVGNMVLALRTKAAEVRAKASAEAIAIEGKVQQLLALENKS